MEQFGRKISLITACKAAKSSPEVIRASLCYLRGLPDASEMIGINRSGVKRCRSFNYFKLYRNEICDCLKTCECLLTTAVTYTKRRTQIGSMIFRMIFVCSANFMSRFYYTVCFQVRTRQAGKQD